MILIILNMEHFKSEENKQSCLLTHEDVLNTSSDNDERVLAKYILFD